MGPQHHYLLMSFRPAKAISTSLSNQIPLRELTSQPMSVGALSWLVIKRSASITRWFINVRLTRAIATRVESQLPSQQPYLYKLQVMNSLRIHFGCRKTFSNMDFIGLAAEIHKAWWRTDHVWGIADQAAIKKVHVYRDFCTKVHTFYSNYPFFQFLCVKHTFLWKRIRAMEEKKRA